MKQQTRTMHGMLARTVVLGLLVLSFATDGWAQGKAATLQDQILGSWTLDSVVLQQGDKRIEPFGSNPKGFASFQRDGSFAYMISRSDLPRVASGNRFTATPEEIRAIYLGTIAYYGKYSVDERNGTLTLRIEVSTFTNWSGTNEERLVKMSGDEMRLVNPSPPTGGTSYVVWKRTQ